MPTPQADKDKDRYRSLVQSYGGVTLPDYRHLADQHGGVSLPHPKDWATASPEEQRMLGLVFSPATIKAVQAGKLFFDSFGNTISHPGALLKSLVAPVDLSMRPEKMGTKALAAQEAALNPAATAGQQAGVMSTIGLAEPAIRSFIESIPKAQPGPEIIPPKRPLGEPPQPPAAPATIEGKVAPGMTHPATVDDLVRRAEGDRAILNPKPAPTKEPAPLPKAVEEPLPKAAPETPAPPFFLKSQQVLNEKMRGPMPATDVLKMLGNAGVKDEEMHWTGLSDLLEEKGNTPVTAQELHQHLAENNVDVQDVFHGSTAEESAARKQRAQLYADQNSLHRALRSTQSWNPDVVRAGKDPFGALVAAYDDPGKEAEAISMFRPDMQESAKDFLNTSRQMKEIDTKYPDLRNYTNPRYPSHVLPGGENYRELLLTMPTGKDYRVVPVEGTGRWKVVDQNGLSKGEFYDRDDAEIAAKVDKRQSGFQSPHWEEPNVLAHVRFNDRTGPNGEKLLHLDEVQSDWHQKGRDIGYEDEAKKELNAKTSELTRQINNTEDAEERQRLWEERRQLQAGIKGQGVPNAPFKKTWHELALKRMLRYASEHGYHGISWTPGDEQAERYDLSKQVNRIVVIPQTGGSRAVRIHPIDDESIKLMVDKDGTVSNAFASGNQYAGKNIADVVGKEVAEKIMSAPEETNLYGVDLKVGGEGMRGFYDKIMPDYLNKYGKRWGAKVGTAEIKTGVPVGKRIEYEYPGSQADLRKDLEQLVNDHPEGWLLEGARRAVGWMDKGHTVDVNDLPDEIFNYLKAEGKLKEKLETKTVPFISITPEMRQSVMQTGQPLFKEAPPSGSAPPPSGGNAIQFVSSFAEVPIKVDDYVDGYTLDGRLVYGRVLETRPNIDNTVVIKDTNGRIKYLDRRHITDLQSSAGTVYALDQTVHDNMRNNIIHTAVNNIANKMISKYNMGGQITVSIDQPTFLLNGKERKVAGHYHPTSRTITVYSRSFQNPQLAEGTMAHEIGHSRFHAGWESGSSELHKLNTDHAFNLQLEQDDGVTPYSREWWTAWEHGEASRDAAVNETVAELFLKEHEYEVQGMPQSAFYAELKPSWQKLYKAIMDAAREAGLRVNYETSGERKTGDSR